VSEKAINQRLLLIAGVIALGVFFIWPPREKLRGGLDIAGGVSMIFEIQEEPGENNPYLAEDMKRLLAKRVDPDGVYNLVWRVHGRNRLEVQMPLPPKDNVRIREAFVQAREALFKHNLLSSQLWRIFRLPAEQREPEIEKLAADVPERRERIHKAVAAYDQYVQAAGARQAAEPADDSTSQPASQPAGQTALREAERDALDALNDAIDLALATNLDAQAFQDALEMSNPAIRKNSIEDLCNKFPQLKDAIQDVVARYDAWKARKVYLDGPADLRRLLRGAGVLEFRILAEPSPDNPTRYDRLRERLHERGPRPAPEDSEGWFRIDNPVAFLNLDSAAELERFDPRSAHLYIVERRGKDWYVLAKLGREHGLLHARRGEQPWRLVGVQRSRDELGRPAVAFELDVTGGALFSTLTGNNIEKQLCILVDDVAYSSARIQSRIRTQGQITGDFDSDKISYLIQTMQAGSLPARLKDTPISEKTIGSSLGETNLRLALNAGIIGSLAVVAIMLVYYLLCGLIANVALFLNVLLILAAMAMLNARFTLDGIAGVILSIGMAVDANVLIFERMREEKERGSSLRVIVKNGYDKALRTILDSNITTLLTCVILYYVGSEEVKGFGLTLGWGIALNLFTSVFVTRTIFHFLLRHNLIRDVRMLKLIGVPNIDWYGKRKIFLPLSAIVIALGLSLVFWRGKRDVLDIEFLGGVEAEVELKQAGLDDRDIAAALGRVGSEIADAGRKLRDAAVEADPTVAARFRIRVPGVEAARLEALLAEPLEAAGLLVRDGVDASGANEITITTPGDASADRVREFVRGHAADAELGGDNLSRANVASVLESEDVSQRGLIWSITTTETNQRLVQHALVAALGQQLRIQPRVHYVVRGRDGQPYPVQARTLPEIIPGLPPGVGDDLTDFLGGAAMYFDQLDPPQTLDNVRTRLRNMRLQPGYQNLPYRTVDVFAVQPAGTDADGNAVYRSVVVAVVDPSFSYQENRDRWLSEFAGPELNLAQATLDSEQTLRKVSQFKPQVAAQSQTQAIVALILSWAMIIVYVWVRFGRPIYGVAGVIALVHDVAVALAFVGFSGLIGGTGHPIGSALLIEDFKVNMPIIAALLTIIGFSINDTIVIFDRVREVRGRLGVVTPDIVNRAINECMSRTILTTLTVFLTLSAMYVFGGSSIRGFNYCMLIGVISGTYSTVAIAGPLLLLRAPQRRPAPAPVPAAA